MSYDMARNLLVLHDLPAFLLELTYCDPMPTNTLTKYYTLNLTQNQVQAVIRAIENDNRELSQDEEDALNQVIAALHKYTDL